MYAIAIDFIDDGEEKEDLAQARRWQSVLQKANQAETLEDEAKRLEEVAATLKKRFADSYFRRNVRETDDEVPATARFHPLLEILDSESKLPIYRTQQAMYLNIPIWQVVIFVGSLSSICPSFIADRSLLSLAKLLIFAVSSPS